MSIGRFLASLKKLEDLGALVWLLDLSETQCHHPSSGPFIPHCCSSSKQPHPSLLHSFILLLLVGTFFFIVSYLCCDSIVLGAGDTAETRQAKAPVLVGLVLR